ncbi:tRNA (N6-threonylcarbamoyladenosine(37)-N6)-methyltransferase TrmO, partial [Chloroflexota bacterium]
MNIEYESIGVIHTLFNSLEEMPIQPTSDTSGPGTIEIFPEFVEGLKDLEGFSHVYLLYHFHKVGAPKLTVTPFLDKDPRGIFATRAPSRPNPIGLSLVKLVRVENDIVYVDQMDVLNGTPLLDIKPYVPSFENVDNFRTGWLAKEKGHVRGTRSDDRFK